MANKIIEFENRFIKRPNKKYACAKRRTIMPVLRLECHLCIKMYLVYLIVSITYL